MKLAGSSGRNRPERCRLALITPAMSAPTWPPPKAGTAIGSGWTSPRLTLTSISARAAGGREQPAARAQAQRQRQGPKAQGRLLMAVIRNRPRGR